MEIIVLSGINLFEGGTLSIYLDCLECLVQNRIYEKYRVIAFVHDKTKFEKFSENIEFIELPKSRKKYLYRLFYEYIYFFFFSLKRKVTYWISLHDMTPNVIAKKRYVYCHNPSPFLKNPEMIKKYSRNLYNMSKFYKYLYRINIKKNDAVIVQQVWMREKFVEMYRVKNVIVAIPEVKETPVINIGEKEFQKEKYTFIYASYPRAFKNFEVICEAAILLKNCKEKFEILLTIDGSENAYSKMLYEKYKDAESIKWMGIQTREQIFELYDKSDCMIFPSKLETWGLPISEYKNTGKTLLVADLPYAYETVGKYDKACFFNVDDPKQLAAYMRDFMNDNMSYAETQENIIDQPCARNWKQLFELILH